MKNLSERTNGSAMKSKQYFPNGTRIGSLSSIFNGSESYRFKSGRKDVNAESNQFGFGFANGSSAKAEYASVMPL
jgi:hypothetical protein